MKKSRLSIFAFVFAALVPGATVEGQEKMSDNKQLSDSDFENFLKEAENAARAFVNGDAGPSNAMMATDMPFALLGGAGGIETDARALGPRFAGITRLYRGGTVTFDYAVKYVEGDIAYTTGIEHRVIRIGGGEPEVTNLRVTQIYRRKDGVWKIVLRHADAAVDTVAPTVENFNRSNRQGQSGTPR